MAFAIAQGFFKSKNTRKPIKGKHFRLLIRWDTLKSARNRYCLEANTGKAVFQRGKAQISVVRS